MSYSTRYWTADGRLMLGAVTRSESSRFETPELAMLRFAGVVDAHVGTHADGMIRGEIVRHNAKPQITLAESGREVRELVSDPVRFADIWRPYEALCATLAR